MSDDNFDNYFEHIMRMSRIYYVSATSREENGESLDQRDLGLKNLSLAFCALYEEHTGMEVWDLASSGFAEDLKKLAVMEQSKEDE